MTLKTPKNQSGAGTSGTMLSWHPTPWTKLSEENLYKKVSCNLVFSRTHKRLHTSFTLTNPNKKNKKTKQKPKTKQKAPAKTQKKKSITGHKITAFLSASHVALLKQVFQVVLRQPVLCNTPLNVFHLVFFLVAALPV